MRPLTLAQVNYLVALLNRDEIELYLRGECGLSDADASSVADRMTSAVESIARTVRR